MLGCRCFCCCWWWLVTGDSFCILVTVVIFIVDCSYDPQMQRIFFSSAIEYRTCSYSSQWTSPSLVPTIDKIISAGRLTRLIGSLCTDLNSMIFFLNMHLASLHTYYLGELISVFVWKIQYRFSSNYTTQIDWFDFYTSLIVISTFEPKHESNATTEDNNQKLQIKLIHSQFTFSSRSSLVGYGVWNVHAFYQFDITRVYFELSYTGIFASPTIAAQSARCAYVLCAAFWWYFRVPNQ